MGAIKGVRLSQATRDLVRTCLPNSAYLRLARIWGRIASLAAMGRREYAALRDLQSKEPGPAVAVQAPGFKRSFLVRPGTTDANEFEHVLLRRTYGCYQPTQPVGLVIDAGANAGYASVFFLDTYPSCKVVAVEPESGNFELAAKNLAPYGDRAKILKMGLWPRRARLRVNQSHRTDSNTVSEVGPSEPYDCEAIDPLSILRESGMNRISIFKCDIEGSEQPLFEQSPEAWLEATDMLFMEIHGAACEEAVYNVMRQQPFRAFRYRELNIFVREKRPR